jgi:LacI family transcriptional regulator
LTVESTPKITPKVTLSQIAKEMGLSISTISMALADDREISEETRRRVREVAQRMHYRPRRKRHARFSDDIDASEARPAGRIALVTIGYEEEPVYVQEMLRTIITASRQRHCRVELADVPKGPIDEQYHHLRRIASGVDGMLLEGFYTAELVQRLLDAAVPLVMLGQVQGDPLGPSPSGLQVMADVHGMAFRATHTMISRGAKRPGLVLVNVVDNLWGYQWLSGYRHALADAQLTPDPRLIKRVQHEGFPGLPMEPDCLELAQNADALIFVNTNVMRNYLQWAQLRGFKLPENRMVIGSSAGAIAAASLSKYTSVTLDSSRLALGGIELLLAGLEGRITPPASLVVPFDFYPNGMTPTR